ncbi:hypothetical protein NA57DRAFT_77095 [Rhizodiscina lignyota]|uniref:Uncharacterized protein n=1 Tax=Rhizodiscina lignyota TaxID=1504668 RepID=A0A9P4M517_9PEZI|nr:hypothetical protein NA57DRAFT_77095 [Rhizodiscina lignyota]
METIDVERAAAGAITKELSNADTLREADTSLLVAIGCVQTELAYFRTYGSTWLNMVHSFEARIGDPKFSRSLKDVWGTKLDGISGPVVFTRFICEVAETFNLVPFADLDARDPIYRQSIDDIVSSLVLHNIFQGTCLAEPKLKCTARQLVFAAFGFVTMAYPPKIDPLNMTNFCLFDQYGTDYCTQSSLVSELWAGRPLLEFCAGFGIFMPQIPWPKADEGLQDYVYSRTMDIASLRSIGGISIHWTACLLSHLYFDESRKRLYLFAIPSYCKLPINHREAITHRTTSAHTQTAGGRLNLLREIEQSCYFLFSPSRRSKRAYNREKQRISEVSGTSGDVFIDQCTTNKIPSTPHRTVYEGFSRRKDFPLLGERIGQLQRFMNQQQPAKIRGLWSDRRNLNNWYTFWVVIFFGTIGVLLSIAQTGLAAVQVSYAIKAYNAQATSTKDS